MILSVIFVRAHDVTSVVLYPLVIVIVIIIINTVIITMITKLTITTTSFVRLVNW